MRRRRLLGVIGAGAMGAFGGCSLPNVSGASEDSHPLSGTTTVRVDDVSATGRDTDALAREGLSFWEAESADRLDFSVSFELVTDRPDVILAFADEPAGCESVDGHPEEVLGCAPLVRAGHAVDPPLTARIVVGNRPPGLVAITVKHELGHLLGRSHEDDPLEIMSARPADRIPLYDTRTAIQDAARAAQQRSNEAMERYNDGVEAWNEERFEDATGSFRLGTERFQAGSERIAAVADRRSDLESVADTADLEALSRQLDLLARRLELGEAFTATMREASAAAAGGDRAEAEELAAEAEETIAEFEALDRPSLRDLAAALGLLQVPNER